MLPISSDTLTKLRAKLAEAREREYSAVIDVANSPFSYVDAKLDELRDLIKVREEIEALINRLNHDGLVKTENVESRVYTQGAPLETLGDW